MLGVKVDLPTGPGIEIRGELHRIRPAQETSTGRKTSSWSFEQDENFAYIAGYTPAGFAYGITWEELELEQESSIHSHEDTETRDNDELGSPFLP